MVVRPTSANLRPRPNSRRSIGQFGFASAHVLRLASQCRVWFLPQRRWHRGMLERGVYLAPSQYEAGFMSLAHTDADIEKTIAAAKEVFAII